MAITNRALLSFLSLKLCCCDSQTCILNFKLSYCQPISPIQLHRFLKDKRLRFSLKNIALFYISIFNCFLYFQQCFRYEHLLNDQPVHSRIPDDAMTEEEKAKLVFWLILINIYDGESYESTYLSAKNK